MSAMPMLVRFACPPLMPRDSTSPMWVSAQPCRERDGFHANPRSQTQRIMLKQCLTRLHAARWAMRRYLKSEHLQQMIHLSPLFCHRLLQRCGRHELGAQVASTGSSRVLSSQGPPGIICADVNAEQACLDRALQLRCVHEHLPHAELCQQRVELLDVACASHEHMSSGSPQSSGLNIWKVAWSERCKQALTNDEVSPVKRFKNACVAFWPANRMRPACSPCVLRPARTSSSVVLPAQAAVPCLAR